MLATPQGRLPEPLSGVRRGTDSLSDDLFQRAQLTVIGRGEGHYVTMAWTSGDTAAAESSSRRSASSQSVPCRSVTVMMRNLVGRALRAD
jgi:hypothetical protein